MTVTTSKIVDQLNKEYGYAKKSASEFINALRDVIINNIENGNDVILTGLCNFKLKASEDREAYNMRENKKCIVPAHFRLKATAGKCLKEAASKYSQTEEGKARL